MIKLCEISEYVNEKIDISLISINQYIANDNMLKNKKGIVTASIFPTNVKVTKFKKGDILVGNIRPYFKKIWKATFDGGCSQDVLVFRNKENISSEFLYSVLASNNFFNYVMLAPKGSKMPRGDKEHIMRYEVNIEFDHELIGNYISSLTDKINNNEKIIMNYNKLIEIIYNSTFLPNEEFVVFDERVNRKIKKDWNVFSFNDIPKCRIIKTGVEYFDKKNYLPTSQIDGELIEDGKDITYENRETRANMQPCLNSLWFAKMKDSIKRICLTQNSQWFIDKYILSTGFFGIECTEQLLPYVYSYIAFDHFESIKNKLAHGDTQQAINGDDLNYIYIPIPTNKELLDFSSKILPILKIKNNLMYENQLLFDLREIAFNSFI